MLTTYARSSPKLTSILVPNMIDLRVVDGCGYEGVSEAIIKSKGIMNKDCGIIGLALSLPPSSLYMGMIS